MKLSTKDSKVHCSIVHYLRSFVLTSSIHFTIIHRSSLGKAEQILNRFIAKFYNRYDVNATSVEL